MSAYKSQINKGTRNLILPKIQSNQTAQISQKNPISLVSQIKILTKYKQKEAKNSPRTPNIIYDYKDIPKIIPNNKIKNNNNSNLLHKLLRSENIHDLVMDNIQLNNNNDLFEQIEKKKKNIYNLYPNFQNSKTFDEITKDELVLEQKTKDFNKKLISLYGKHSSKFHSKKEDDSQKINDILHLDLKSIKDENINNNDKNNNNNQLSSRNPNNYKNMNLFRKKMAFHFRFMQNNSTKKKKLNKSFKSKNKKMNKILQISKSIPDILLYEIKSINNTNKNNNIINSYDNNKKLEEENLQNYKAVKEYGFLSPYKGNRYIGNFYDYYKSNNCLNEKNLIFSQNKNYNNNIIYEKINKINDEDELSQFNNNKLSSENSENGDINAKIIKKNGKSGMIHLSSLLL